ncbi:hypothetical protein ACK301_19100, partial [Aeromonas caviae]
MQEENAALQALSKRYNLPIYERMVDNGKSAFHGHHIEGGQCSGQLNPDTWLGRSSAFAGAIPSLC